MYRNKSDSVINLTEASLAVGLLLLIKRASLFFHTGEPLSVPPSSSDTPSEWAEEKIETSASALTSGPANWNSRTHDAATGWSSRSTRTTRQSQFTSARWAKKSESPAEGYSYSMPTRGRTAAKPFWLRNVALGLRMKNGLRSRIQCRVVGSIGLLSHGGHTSVVINQRRQQRIRQHVRALGIGSATTSGSLTA